MLASSRSNWRWNGGVDVCGGLSEWVGRWVCLCACIFSVLVRVSDSASSTTSTSVSVSVSDSVSLPVSLSLSVSVSASVSVSGSVSFLWYWSQKSSSLVIYIHNRYGIHTTVPHTYTCTTYIHTRLLHTYIHVYYSIHVHSLVINIWSPLHISVHTAQVRSFALVCTQVNTCTHEHWHVNTANSHCFIWQCALQNVTPSTQSNLFPKLISFFHVETHKVSTSIWGLVSHFSTQATSWRGSFRTFIEHRPWTGLKTVRIWLKIE